MEGAGDVRARTRALSVGSPSSVRRLQEMADDLADSSPLTCNRSAKPLHLLNQHPVCIESFHSPRAVGEVRGPSMLTAANADGARPTLPPPARPCAVA